MQKVCLQAHAKINLCLNVKGKRSDGYHDLEMVMVPLMLHDEIIICVSELDTLICEDETMTLDETNTITKAIKIMRETYHIQESFQIQLHKNIPMQAGLAGGSSDAAAVMLGINELLQLDIPKVELAQQSKNIGADVPFCVMNTCAVVEGIGEIITPIQMNCPFDILLVKPTQGVPTGPAFQRIDFSLCAHPDVQKVKVACEKNDYETLCESLQNSLEYSAFQMVPEISEIKTKLQQLGFDGVLMSGSGSTVFALTRNKQLLEQTAMDWKKLYPFVEITNIYKASTSSII